MTKSFKASSAKISDWKFNVFVFVVAFVVLGLLFTLQMFILGNYIQYMDIPVSKGIAVIICWIAAATVVTIAIIHQIGERYRKPVQRFAEAADKVAAGDFSVYVPPRHRGDKFDHLDKIFTDFNKMVEELGSIETLKTDFFSNVSHEIKTPLAVIQNYGELLRQEKIDYETRVEYADVIVSAAGRLADLISNILKLNKLEKQNILPETASYDLCRQLCECAVLFEDQWEQKNINFVIQIEDQAFIEADASLLEMVWNNLLSNAIKFTPPGGTVTLSQISDENGVIVTVSDTGSGMDENTQKKIFEKFYQGDTSHATEGNGLGLALVWRIVTLLEGEITVKSQLGEGSLFAVRLPECRM